MTVPDPSTTPEQVEAFVAEVAAKQGLRMDTFFSRAWLVEYVDIWLAGLAPRTDLPSRERLESILSDMSKAKNKPSNWRQEPLVRWVEALMRKHYLP